MYADHCQVQRGIALLCDHKPYFNLVQRKPSHFAILYYTTESTIEYTIESTIEYTQYCAAYYTIPYSDSRGEQHREESTVYYSKQPLQQKCKKNGKKVTATATVTVTVTYLPTYIYKNTRRTYDTYLTWYCHFVNTCLSVCTSLLRRYGTNQGHPPPSPGLPCFVCALCYP